MNSTTSAHHPSLAISALLANAFLWGISWLPFRTLQELGMHSLWTTTLIYSVATMLVLVRFPDALRQVLRSRWLLLLALAAGLTNACFNWGVTVGNVLRVVLLFYLMPVWAILLARWLLGERITRAALIRVMLAVSGAVTVLYSPQIGVPLPTSLGDWLGLAGSVVFALTNVLLRRQAEDPPQTRSLALFAGPVLIPGLIAFALASTGPQPTVPWPIISPQVLLFAALTTTMLMSANLMLQYGAARLPTNVTTVVIITEVAFAALSSWLIGGEVPTGRTLIGGAMIVTASALAAFSAPEDDRRD